MEDRSKNSHGQHIDLTVEAHLIPVFFQLLQDGFRIEGNVGCSVKSFLCEQLGIAPEYLEKRIQTIFLDSKPVDDVETAIVRDGTILSLSAALPGLVGAVLRRGGYYAPMREQISYKDDHTLPGIQSGRICMKLFNLPLRELGPVFLERGIGVDGEKLKEVFTDHADDFRTGCKASLVNDRPLDLLKLKDTAWEKGDIFLRVRAI